MGQIAKKIAISDIEEGDTITVVSDNNLYTEVKVVRVDYDGSFYSECLGFDPNWGWKYYLVERPKKPLPTKLGSVVEADGQTWVLCDPNESPQWRSIEGVWQSVEELQEYDFTVV